MAAPLPAKGITPVAQKPCDTRSPPLMHIHFSMHSVTPASPNPPKIIFATCASCWLTNHRTTHALPAAVNSCKSSSRPAAPRLQTASKSLNPLTHGRFRLKQTLRRAILLSFTCAALTAFSNFAQAQKLDLAFCVSTVTAPSARAASGYYAHVTLTRCNHPCLSHYALFLLPT